MINLLRKLLARQREALNPTPKRVTRLKILRRRPRPEMTVMGNRTLLVKKTKTKGLPMWIIRNKEQELARKGIKLRVR